MVSKTELKAELVQLLLADVAAAERAQQTTIEGATHEEAKPENDKDTRALEQSYLARGQARRVEDLKAELAQAQAMPTRDFKDGERISLGALVTVEEDDATRVFFLAPGRGGTVIAGDIQIVTPASPLGRALLGKVAGDDCELRAPGTRQRNLGIVDVR
ncbi:MAG: transcription elongation factor GreAB [Polyangiaceae bacterium]|nr:transcription elongation factor GreAB [Polyangiaceae bacterium]